MTQAGSCQAPPRAYPFTVQKRPGPSEAVRQLNTLLKQALGAGQPGRSQVYEQEDDQFATSSLIFNGAVKTAAFALVKPINASDVSIVVKFCREHNLELSVKAGGYGVHGWSVAGDIVIDLSLLDQISIALPDEATTLQDSFSSLGLDDTIEEDMDTRSVPAQRPSIVSSHASSDSTLSVKRTAEDASMSSDEDEPEGKKRLDTIQETNAAPSSTSSGSNPGMSRSSSNTHSGSGRSGSGFGSSSSSGGAGSNSTPGTSLQSSEGKPALSLSNYSLEGSALTVSPTAVPFESPSSSSGTPPIPQRQPQMTYVNPSPTTTSAFPFIPTTFQGGSSSSSSSFPSSFAGSSSSRLTLNTNPDPPPYTVVTFGAGVHSKQLDAATASSKYGAFYVPTSAFPVGSGQFISGGFGFIGRKHGLAMDNVMEVELVLPDGRIVWVGENGRHGGEWKDSEDPNEVWWGVRGAGAVLGVITRYRTKAHYLPSVYAGNMIYVFDRATAASLLRHIRDCVKGSPRSMYTNLIMTAGPPGSPAIIVVQLCFSGPRTEADGYIQAISSWEGGRCLFQDFSERTFERQQLAVEEVLKGGQGRKWYIKSDMLVSLTDEVIDETCSRFHVVPDGCTWLFEYTGGSIMSEVKDSCFPVSHREASFTVAALHQWSHTESPIEDSRCVTTAEDWINEVIHPNSPGGPIPCFLQSSSLQEVMGVYGENYPRLARLKKAIDPTNLYKHSMWPHDDSPKQGLIRDKINGKSVLRDQASLPDGELDVVEKGVLDANHQRMVDRAEETYKPATGPNTVAGLAIDNLVGDLPNGENALPPNSIMDPKKSAQAQQQAVITEPTKSS